MQTGIEKLPVLARTSLINFREKHMTDAGSREDFADTLKGISITDSYYRQLSSGYYSPSIKVVMRLIQFKVISFSDLEGWYYV